ncbi:hypothetical protein HK101_001503 [Irineochytrium annulatum]|nr:hypothetical protein HK101_001503 [Irineochytrium annulatum]
MAVASHATPAPSVVGDLVEVTTSMATVGVLLDDFSSSPELMEAASKYFMGKHHEFWHDRALLQLSLLSLGVVSLAMPDPVFLDVTFHSPAQKIQVDGHTLIARNYTMKTHIVGSYGGAAAANAALNATGAVIDENMILPVDPVLIMQRTGFDCVFEGDLPLHSVDAEGANTVYYDQCTAEPPYDPSTGPCEQCHCSQVGTQDCRTTVAQNVGGLNFTVTSKLIKWDEALASKVESKNIYSLTVGDPAVVGGANIVGDPRGFNHNILIYRYYATGTCEALECLPAAGWRRLLLFDTTEMNIGTEKMEMLDMTYDSGTDGTSFNEAAFHFLYYWFQCHMHPHFSAYAHYTLGDLSGKKQGFCVEDGIREINSRHVEFRTTSSCKNQGISPGWADSYQIGIPCQWIDVTDIDTTSPVNTHLNVTVNPKGWMCEGTKVLDNNGTDVFIFTGEYTTSPPYQASHGPIDTFKCINNENSAKDNTNIIDIHIPKPGEGALTSACINKGQLFGARRDCELPLLDPYVACPHPGQNATLVCHFTGSSSKSSPAKAIRVCESSVALKTGTACRFNDPFMLAYGVVGKNQTAEFTFTCPAARDAVEVGGFFSIYAGDVLNTAFHGNEAKGVSCHLAQ